MKKLFISSFLFTLSLLIPTQTFATQGTCSWHGGVNCSAGADWDGSAICNDGWKDSSEVFYGMQECKVETRHSCTSYEWSNLQSKFEVDKKLAKVESLRNEILAINVESNTQKQNIGSNTGGITNTDRAGFEEQINRQNAVKILTLTSQLLPLEGEYTSSFNQAKEECYTLGGKEYLQLIKDSYNKTYTSQQSKLDTKEPVIIDGGYSRGPDLYCNTGYSKDAYNLRCVRDVSVAICGQDVDQQGSPTMSCRCVASYKWMGGSKCQKYNIQTGELVEETPLVVQSITRATSTVSISTSTIFNRTLKKGMTGDDVKQLQIFLQKLNYLPVNFTPSSYFGNVTNVALIKFQKENSIQPSTGTFGSLTQRKLLSLVKN